MSLPRTISIEQRRRYCSDDFWNRMQDIVKDNDTPCLVINGQKIRENYESLMRLFPGTSVHYAVKANPNPEILKLLNSLGSHFDIASTYELDLLLSLNISPERLSYGNTIKKVQDIRYAYEKGVRLFSCDSSEDLAHISQEAPQSKVLFRIATDGLGADWPLSRKFGCHQDMVYQLATQAKAWNLEPYGVIFHVGSQQRDIGQWDEGISKCKYIFSMLKDEGIHLQCINIGGGLPANYVEPTPSIDIYAQEIKRYLEEDFGTDMPHIMMEPGRYLVGDAGILATEVVLITRKSTFNLTRWVYLDAGKFNGLIETIDELIKFPIYLDSPSDAPASEVILAGPTCDSQDILYEKFKYFLPEDLKIGDKIYFLTTGAYTQSYSSVAFNGFPPLQCHFLP